MQPTDPLDDTLKRRLSYFYLAWALVLLVIGTVVLTQVTRQIGLTYGGFIWTYDPSRTPPFYVGPELWRFRPPSPQELRLGDVIQSIDGRSPWEFEQVYTSKQPGEIVTYDIERDKQPLVVKEPVRLFTWDAFLISHGLLYLTGVSYLLAGYVLLRGTRRKDLAVLAFVFPPAAGAWLFHGVAASIHAPYEGPPWIGLLLWTPAMPLAAAVLLHFAMIFPSPNRLVTKYPAIPLVGYGIAVLLIVFYATTFRVETTELGYIAFVAMLVYLVISMIAVVAGSAIGYRNAVRQNERRATEDHRHDGGGVVRWSGDFCRLWDRAVYHPGLLGGAVGGLDHHGVAATPGAGLRRAKRRDDRRGCSKKSRCANSMPAPCRRCATSASGRSTRLAMRCTTSCWPICAVSTIRRLRPANG